MKNCIFKGNCTAIVTPFTKSGKKIDYISFKKLIEYQIENNTDALLFLGTTGESSTLSKKEKVDIVKFAIKIVNKRVPIIVGSGSNNTQTAIKNSILFESLGVDGLLHITPYYNKCTQQGLIQHFTQIASATKLPIIMYNVPSRTGINISVDSVLKLSKIPNIVGIKEASGNINQILEIRLNTPNDFSIYSGDDVLTLPILSIGGVGVISVVGNILPNIMHNICFDFFKENMASAKESQLKLLPLIKMCFCEVNPIPIKKALALCGFCNSKLRLPLTELSNPNTKQLKSLLVDFNLI